MNILIPHSWLLENLQTQASPEEIQKYLSLCGPSVERILQKEGEAVYDIEITTNRVDSMSVRGIAREAAIILNQFQVAAKFLPYKNLAATTRLSTLSLPEIINDPKLCKRVTCVILEGIKRQPTPDWMGKRLKQIDQNIHDAAVDITNYVTHELGHPCHAFDYDKLMATGGEIHIVESGPGETFTTLDGTKFVTVGGEVVFKNAKGMIIDLPSIKGTLNTSIDAQTKNVLLLLESIEAKKVRFASMTHAIRTTAAQLMEKGVDPHLAEVVLQKCIELYQTLCQTQAVSQIYDDFPREPKPCVITLHTQTVWQYLGINLDQSLIVNVLSQLECQVKVAGQQTLEVTPPSFRPDLETPVDLVEEIARIYGYHRLPSTLMATSLPLNHSETQNFDLEQQIKLLLTHLGTQELYTYSLVSAELAEQSGFSLQEHVKLQNPLAEDKVYLRRSLIPSLIEAVKQNPNYPQLQVFEIANTYQPQENSLPQEKLMLGLASKTSYRQARGVIEVLLENLFIKDWQFSVESAGAGGAEIRVKNKQNQFVTIGNILVNNEQLVLVQIELKTLFSLTATHPVYQPIGKTTPIIEDLTFKLEPQTLVGKIIETIKAASDKVAAVDLKTVYGRNFTFTITYLDKSDNLNNQKIKPIRKDLVTQVEAKNLGQLIGSLE